MFVLLVFGGLVFGQALVFAVPVFAAPQPPPLGHKTSAWSRASGAQQRAAMKMGSAYRRFIDSHRTEREVVEYALSKARKLGFTDLFGRAGTKAKGKAGTRLHASRHGKIAAFVVVGKKPLREGVHVVAAHVDSVRIDLKQTPLYAKGNLALLETHYYGSIKKYQWLSQPLQLRGVVVRRDGKKIKVAIGDDPGEPVLVIPDIAVHLSRYVDKHEGEETPGESLDPILSSTPSKNKSKGQDPYAREATRLLESQLGIKIADLASAELQLVPAAPARDVGLDRALVGAYGQDDRACAYAALEAIWQVKTPEHTSIVVLVDKEEVGSAGNTGARSNFVRRVVAELLEGQGIASTAAAVSEVLAASIVLSADTSGAVNPHFPELYDRKNASFLGSGVIWDQSGVHAEILGYVRGLFNRAGITHQPSTWGKTRGSKGSESTVLQFFTRLGMDGMDVSIPLLSMHSTYELISKIDLYESYRAYRAFLND